MIQKVKLGKSDVYVTPITFGAWAIGGWMWGGADEKDALDALEYSIDNGITSIDTAAVYGFGKSEEIVGEAIKGKRDKVEILTKYGLKWVGQKGEFFFDTIDNSGKPAKIYKYASKESIIEECEASLRRLKTDYIDLYQIHWPDGTTPVEESMEAIERLIEKGKIRAAGVSNYDVTLSKRASAKINLASNQVPYSMLNRGIEKELVPWCLENEVSILAYSPLQRGLLTGKITTDYKFNEGDTRPDSPYFRKENILKIDEFLQSVRTIASEKNATVAQVVIAWTLAQPGITVALVGARNSDQVNDNIKALEVNLSDQQIRNITEQLNKLEIIL